jgi:hypothetical protein
MLTLDHLAGTHISTACVKAVVLANFENQDVCFTFNDTQVIAHPGDSAEELATKWHAASEAAAKAWRESPEYIAREKKRAEDYAARCAAAMVESAHTEKEMADAKSPWPYTCDQLMQYIDSLVNRSHDYGTCVYALSLGALAAFNFISHKLGVTGFQASCADLDFVKRNRSIKGPFILLKAEDALYPQYDLQAKLHEALKEWQPWLSEEAEKRLAGGVAHPNVVAHWKKLANREKVK